MDLGLIGVWSGTLRNGERSAVVKACAELEDLGYGTIWFPGGQPDGYAEHVQALLDGTRHALVAPGIVNIWTHPAEGVAAQHHAFNTKHPGRYLLGLGVSHHHVVERAGMQYARPMQKMKEYLDSLDRAATPVPCDPVPVEFGAFSPPVSAQPCSST